jgi:hypothetical protein
MKCFIGAGLVMSALFIGCSDEREPVPGVPVDAAVLDAAVRDAVTEPRVSADVSIDVPGPDGYIDLFDVFPLPDAGCPGCIRDRCGSQINACFNNPACTAGVFCTLQMCAGGLLGDSGFDPSSFTCVLGCFNGDQNLAFMALGSLTCLTMTCGVACNFVDAGSDARPPNLDAPARPDASTDTPSQDVTADTATPDADPPTDSGQNADADDATPGDDAGEDTTGTDVTTETADPVDGAPPVDVTPDAIPPDEDAGAE